MAAFDSFYSLILPWVPAASGPAIDNALRQAAIDFCRETWIWQATSDRVGVLAGVNVYDIESPNGAVPVKVLSMTIDGIPVEPRAPDELDMAYVEWSEKSAYQPAYFTQTQPDQFILVNKPNTSRPDALAYRAAYRPSEVAPTLPDVLLAFHARAVADGALAILCTEKDTMDAETAVYRAALFEQAKLDVKTAVQMGFARAAMRTRAQFF